MNSIFSFFRRRPETPSRESPAEPARGEESPPEPAPSEAPMPTAPRATAAPAPSANSTPALDQVLDDMLNVLKGYLPDHDESDPFPAPGVSVTSLTERALAVGNQRGTERRGSFAVVALKGGRLDAVVRFQLWETDASAVDTAIAELHGRLLAAKDDLWTAGFLRVTAEGTSLAQHVSGLNAWRKTADYRVLYEFHYEDSKGAESLIARIPISIDSEYGESTIVTDEKARWDNEATTALVVRGRFSVGSLSALAFIPGLPPSGTITLMRTFDGAVSPPTTYPSLAEFLTAVAGPGAPERHGQVTFASLSDFLAVFSAAGDPIMLGDWDDDGIPDSYEPRVLSFEPTIQLPSAADRLELTYQGDAFDQVAVVYLRATQR